jgi:Protein of unknown function (DUF4242)
MTLYLYEIVTAAPDRARADQVLKDLDAHIHHGGGELIEAQITAGAHRIFAVAEFDGTPAVFETAALDVELVSGPDEVRLVGANLATIKEARPAAGYLVEWDLPADLDMASYLARKQANAPKYADVPEVSFLRTYVREDMNKCLCFYDAPDEAAVRRAREAVSTPIDRLHGLQGDPQ